MPGRIRLKIPVLTREPQLGSTLVDELRSAPGVREVRANQACGSLIVHFHADRIDPATLRNRVHDRLSGRVTPSRSMDPATHELPVKARGLSAPEGGRLRRILSRSWLDPRGWHLPGRRSPEAPPPALVPTQPPAAYKTPMAVCQMNAHMMRWMLRTSMSYWWHELTNPRPRSVQGSSA
jgi:hypothetical protein